MFFIGFRMIKTYVFHKGFSTYVSHMKTHVEIFLVYYAFLLLNKYTYFELTITNICIRKETLQNISFSLMDISLRISKHLNFLPTLGHSNYMFMLFKKHV